MPFVERLDAAYGGVGGRRTGGEGQIRSVSRIRGSFFNAWPGVGGRRIRCEGQIQSVNRIREAECLSMLTVVDLEVAEPEVETRIRGEGQI